MKNLTVRKIQEITGGKIYNAKYDTGVEITAVVSDSRKVTEGCLFLCIPGEHVDGHDFAKQAVADGAFTVLAEHRITNLKAPYVVVDSILEATQALAAYYRKSLNIKVVGVTGSVGKTSTKEFIAAVLRQQYRTKKTKANFNNEWGVPFTIFDITESDEAAVIEMGIDNFGAMNRLGAMVKPDIVVMTNIGQSHLENLKTRDGILRAKSEIFNHMSPDGHIVLNGDDDKLTTLTDVRGIRPEFYGLGKRCSVSAERIVTHGFEGTEFNVVIRDRGGKMSFHVKMPILGKHMVYNALAAVQVGIDMKIPLLKIKAGLESVREISGRNNIIKTDKYTIIDDVYNASPASMQSSINVLQNAQGRKVAILGDMFELGEDSDKYHFRVGQYVGRTNTDLIICIGANSEKMFMGAKLSSEAQVEYYRTLDEAMDMIPIYLKPGDTILVKASHGMNFQQIIYMLTNGAKDL